MKNKGYFIIVVLVLGSLGIAGISGLVGFANNNLSAGRRTAEGVQALQLAEAGVEYYRDYLNDGGDVGVSSIERDLLDINGALVGTYDLTIDSDNQGLRLLSVGYFRNSVRRIEVRFSQGDPAVFIYGGQSGTGGIELGNNAEIIGNVYSNGDITGGNGSSIDGDASAVGAITGVNVTGVEEVGVSPIDFPVSQAMIDGWKSDASVDVHTGNMLIGGVNNLLGPIKIEGDLNISGTASVVLTGNVYVTGEVNVGNSVSVTLSDSYGSYSGVIIADGEISVGNSAVFNDSGTTQGGILLVSLANSPSAVILGNGANVDMIYAPLGTVNIGNNLLVKVVNAETISLANNVSLEYENEVLSTVFTNTSSGNFNLFSWKEVR